MTAPNLTNRQIRGLATTHARRTDFSRYHIELKKDARDVAGQLADLAVQSGEIAEQDRGTYEEAMFGEITQRV